MAHMWDSIEIRKYCSYSCYTDHHIMFQDSGERYPNITDLHFKKENEYLYLNCNVYIKK